MHIYATPPGNFGFSWHYDAEDVFILQTAGEKEYELRKNTVHPWPLDETIPVDMRHEREITPLMRVSLGAGDLLYIPCGYWHRATAMKAAGTAISLAVGVTSPSAIDVFDRISAELLKSPVWRQRLPVLLEISDSEVEQDPYSYLFGQLAIDFARTINSREFREALLSAELVDQSR